MPFCESAFENFCPRKNSAPFFSRVHASSSRPQGLSTLILTASFSLGVIQTPGQTAQRLKIARWPEVRRSFPLGRLIQHHVTILLPSISSLPYVSFPGSYTEGLSPLCDPHCWSSTHTSHGITLWPSSICFCTWSFHCLPLTPPTTLTLVSKVLQRWPNLYLWQIIYKMLSGLPSVIYILNIVLFNKEIAFIICTLVYALIKCWSSLCASGEVMTSVQSSMLALLGACLLFRDTQVQKGPSGAWDRNSMRSHCLASSVLTRALHLVSSKSVN